MGLGDKLDERVNVGLSNGGLPGPRIGVPQESAAGGLTGSRNPWDNTALLGLNQVWGRDMHVPIMAKIDRVIPRAGLTQTSPHNPLVRPEPGPVKLCAAVFLLPCMFYGLLNLRERHRPRSIGWRLDELSCMKKQRSNMAT